MKSLARLLVLALLLALPGELTATWQGSPEDEDILTRAVPKAPPAMSDSYFGVDADPDNDLLFDRLVLAPILSAFAAGAFALPPSARLTSVETLANPKLRIVKEVDRCESHSRRSASSSRWRPSWRWQTAKAKR